MVNELQFNIEVGQSFNLAHTEALLLPKDQYLEAGKEERQAILVKLTNELWETLHSIKVAKLAEVLSKAKENTTPTLVKPNKKE